MKHEPNVTKGNDTNLSTGSGVSPYTLMQQKPQDVLMIQLKRSHFQALYASAFPHSTEATPAATLRKLFQEM